MNTGTGGVGGAMNSMGQQNNNTAAALGVHHQPHLTHPADLSGINPFG